MKKLFILVLIQAFIFQLYAQDIEVEPIQLTLVTKRTATWCPPCGAWGWSAFEGILQDNADRAVTLALHYSTHNDPFYTPTAQDLIDNVDGFPGRPGFIVNEEALPIFNENDVRNTVKERVDNNFASAPVAQMGILATINPENYEATINTRTQFFQAANGEYYLSLFLVYKSVISYQASQGEDANHKNVLVTELSGHTFGELLAEGDISMGATYDKKYVVQGHASEDLDNIKLVSVLWKKNGEHYQLVNINFTDEIVEQMVSSLEETAPNSGFSIFPNITDATAQIELILAEKAKQAEIVIFDSNGKKVKSLFSGAMDAGKQDLTLKRTDVSSAGIYWVRLLIDGQMWSRKVVFR